MTDRLQMPPITVPDKLAVPEPNKVVFPNGTEVWLLEGGSQELCKIDFLFDAGSWYQSANLVAGLTNAFLNQGTRNSTAQQSAEFFDSRGAYLQQSADQQYGFVSVLTLNTYLDDILAKTAEIIFEPVFPEMECRAQIAKKKQQFRIENSKVKVMAQKRFSQVLFGERHPYANTNSLDDYDRLTREQMIAFHEKNYRKKRPRIVVAGNRPEQALKQLESLFGRNEVEAEPEETSLSFPVASDPEHVHWVEKADALQSAIRIGRPVPGYGHPDFEGLIVLSTLLGGYFGSRLMTKLREEKGYTYGIGSGIFILRNAAYFSIMTEVGAGVGMAALNEIANERRRLIAEAVSDKELDLVRNFMTGEILRSIDGILATSETLKAFLENDRDLQQLNKQLQTIRQITPERLQELAHRYLHDDQLWTVVAGPLGS
ncbi:MAG TPA: pitrilysin family protein [Prolixibacteraceae bacterium]|nr:pitrilysin family protein [Prolixibacteraceae bacterium]